MADLSGITVWDFAYHNGRCTLTCRSNSFGSSESETETQCPIRQQNKSSDGFFPGTPTTTKVDSEPSRSKPRSIIRSISNRESQSKQQDPLTQRRSYLLSIPNPSCTYYKHVVTTVSTMLMTPYTHLVLLVPQSDIVCPKVCVLSRLPKAVGSGIRILPVPPSTTMECSSDNVDHCDDDGSGAGKVSDMDEIGKMAKRISKYAKVKSFDGYLPLQETRACWYYLEKVGKEVSRLGGK
ncbi:hypothetical protein B0A52_06273 [Exophiala mesophila]|uniref:Uncharacterized protein n=1 Tax=Exophiala mesophila TaxID=212818 RepID=A0A438N2Y7_EXOME|nr:hypothetical protein B0A52_06273 [Exophiala mesophila]